MWKTLNAALTHEEDEGLKSLLCHTCYRTWVSLYTSTGVGQLLATPPKIDGSQIWGAGGKKSVMIQALWGVALLSCKVWHLVQWLAEHVGWVGIQSLPCSVGQLGSPEWRRVVFYHWGGYMLTHIITDLLSQQSTSQTAYPMKHSQNLRQTHLLPSLKATVKQETQQWRGSWTTTAWSRTHGTDTTLHGWSSQPESKGILTACCILWAKSNSCHLTRIKSEKY